MQFTIGEIEAIFLAFLSVVVNIFLLYRARITKSAFAFERRFILSTISSTLNALEGVRA